MTPLNEYLQDGANKQARAVLCMLQGFHIEASWNGENRRWEAEPHVSRWQNCREQGYVITLRAPLKAEMLNIAFFEHRNSDEIHAIKWEQWGINAPTIETAKFDGQCYRDDKYDTSHCVGYGEIQEMAVWIAEELEDWWLKASEAKKQAQQPTIQQIIEKETI